MINYPTFTKLYTKASECSGESKFILECGWQSWMKSSEDESVELLKEIYRLAKGGLTAIIESFPTQKSFCEEYGVPYKTMQKWVGGTYAPADYLVSLMAYALALKKITTEESTMDKTAIMYVTEDNSGRRAILFSYSGEWYYCDCAPYDVWGDVDLHEILEGEEDGMPYRECIAIEALAEKLRAQNELFTDYCSADFIEERIGFKVAEYSGMNVAEIQEKEYDAIVLVGEVEVAQ